VLSQRIRLSDADIDLLAELLAADGLDTSALVMVPVSDTDPMPMYAFSPRQADMSWRGPSADRPPQPPLAQAEPEDLVDDVFVSTVRLRFDARAGWRCWRYPGDGAPWPQPRRVYLIETDVGADLARIASFVQSALADVGEPQPQVEVYPTGAALPSYQRLARGSGALLWARTPDPLVKVAAPFDLPLVAEGARSWSPETHLIVAYLRGGEPLLVGPMPLDDALDPARPRVVEARLRTDGFWIWDEAWAYYLERYGVPPQPDLLAHIRERQYQPPLVDGAAMHRALAAMPQPWANQPHWTFGT
jgi:hypothetical protein